MLTFGSLFSGIGGIDLGFERAGLKCLWQVEKNDWARKVLKKHWPHVERFTDVKETGKHNLAPVDIIAGGFPCQPHSLAGGREASSDERDLWPEFARIIGEIKPRWIVAENVPGLLSSENGWFFGAVLKDLAQIGYDAEWHSIPAATFSAIHIRQRIFILAYPKRYSVQGWQVVPPKRGEKSRKEQLSRLLQSRFGSTLSEPNNGRNLDGVPRRVDRNRGLGNAVHPEVAEYIARLILRTSNNGLHATPTARSNGGVAVA